MPVQRIPRYALFLKVSIVVICGGKKKKLTKKLHTILQELIKFTGSTHPDYKLLNLAASKITAQLNELNAGIDKQAAAQAQQICLIEDSIQGDIIPNEV